MSVPVVLIVDDEEDISDLIARTVRRSGFAPRVVATGEAALEYLADHHVDLVVLDIGLPGMDGWNVLRTLRAGSSRSADVKVLVVTVFDDGTPPDQAGVAHLAKPFRPTELGRILDSLLLPHTETTHDDDSTNPHR